jgi:hypothetical protein
MLRILQGWHPHGWNTRRILVFGAIGGSMGRPLHWFKEFSHCIFLCILQDTPVPIHKECTGFKYLRHPSPSERNPSVAKSFLLAKSKLCLYLHVHFTIRLFCQGLKSSDVHTVTLSVIYTRSYLSNIPNQSSLTSSDQRASLGKQVKWSWALSRRLHTPSGTKQFSPPTASWLLGTQETSVSLTQGLNLHQKGTHETFVFILLTFYWRESPQTSKTNK